MGRKVGYKVALHLEFIGLILCINAHLICYILEIHFSLMTYFTVLLIVLWFGILALFVFMLSLLRDIPSSEALRFVLSLSVSAVPEGLPVALTVIIVLGMRRMAGKKALVRSLPRIYPWISSMRMRMFWSSISPQAWSFTLA